MQCLSPLKSLAVGGDAGHKPPQAERCWASRMELLLRLILLAVMRFHNSQTRECSIEGYLVTLVSL